MLTVRSHRAVFRLRESLEYSHFFQQYLYKAIVVTTAATVTARLSLDVTAQLQLNNFEKCFDCFVHCTSTVRVLYDNSRKFTSIEIQVRT